MEYTFNHLGHLLETAQRAYYWTSQNPEGRGFRTLKDFDAQLHSDLETIIDDEAKARYKQKYIQLFCAWLSAQSRCASSFVTGPSGFNVRRAEKANNRERAQMENFNAWRAKALKAIAKSQQPEATLTELQEARQKLEQRKVNHAFMKSCNKILSSKKTNDDEKRAALLELGVKPENLEKLMIPDRVYGRGFPSFSLTNNNAEIRRLEGRVKMLEAKEQKAVEQIETGEAPSIKIGEVEILQNFDADRVQIMFPEIPPMEVRSELKSHGFKWSPRFSAWQRKLTNNATYYAKQIVTKHYQPAI